MKTILVTIGDPAGCGPYITLSALTRQPKSTRFIVVGDKAILKKIPLYKKAQSRFMLIDARTPGIETLVPGKATSLSGKASLNYLDIALAYMKKNNVTRLVTAPLSKEAVQLTHPGFSGHTEYLAHHYKINSYEMMMVSRELKVVLLTRHIGLARVSSHIRAKSLSKSIKLIHSALRSSFGLRYPRIVFAAINPHAGVYTFLKKEERAMLNAIKLSKKNIAGPLPADTLFTPHALKKFDCVLCGYHDQGMIPFKLLSFTHGVNLTIGLPILRTSPAHGTAFDILAQGDRPFSTSMTAAIEICRRLTI